LSRQTEFYSDATTETAVRLLEIVRDLAAELHPEYREPIRPTLDSSLDRDLGFDSLAQIELLSRIEESLDISIPERNLATVDTLRDLLRAVISSSHSESGEIPGEIGTVQLPEVADAPYMAETLVDVLRWHVKNHPERPHIRLFSDGSNDEIITYLDLWEGAELAAAGLQHFGLESGEAVLIMLPTGKDYFYIFFGVLLAGGIPVPTYPPGRLKQIEEHLLRHTAIAKNCQARIMVTMEEAKRFARLMHTWVANLHHVLIPSELREAGNNTLSEFRRPSLKPDSIAFLQYTSGSTGMPKGVILSHANLLANIRAMARAIHVTSEDIFVSWLPLYHDMGLIGAWLGSLHFACQLVIMEPLAFIARPQRWLWAIHKFGATLSAAPNFAYELCLRRIDDKNIQGLDLSSWRIAFNGAEAVNPETVKRFISRFADFGFRPETMMPVYGLAESSVGLAFPTPGTLPLIDRIKRAAFMDNGKALQAADNETDPLEFISCGQPLPGHQIRIVGSGGREVPERIEGDLQFTGPSSTSGYFKNPEKTRELFDGRWLNAGDRAYMAEGNVYITGRTKDIIIRAGRNIYPTELEEAVGKISGIRKGNVAAFGSKSKDTGTERLIVLAETRKRDQEARQNLIKRVNSVVTDLAGTPPDEVVLAPPNTVLKTSSGKIRRNATREIYEQKLVGKTQPAVWLQLARYTLKGLLPRIRLIFRQMLEFVFAAWSWISYCLLALPVAVLVLILPREKPRWVVMRYGARLLAILTGTKIRIRGFDNLPAKKTPCILVANHASYLDGYLLTAVMDRPISFIAKAELRSNRLIALLLKRIGTQFVERFDQQQSREDVKTLAETGMRGRSLFFFPEGTFMRMPGLLPFKMGAFETAVRTGRPIVPIAIRGTRSILRADSWFPRNGIISITFGAPIICEAVLPDEHYSWATAIQLRDKTRKWLLAHCGEPDLSHERPHLQPPGTAL